MCPITRTCSEYKSCWQSPLGAQPLPGRFMHGFHEEFLRIPVFRTCPITRTFSECKSCWQSGRAQAGSSCTNYVSDFRNTCFLNVSDYENLCQIQVTLAIARPGAHFPASGSCTDSAWIFRTPVFRTCPITRTSSEYKSCGQSPPGGARAASAPAVHARTPCGFCEYPFSE
jgi:hypothetical protein